MHRFFFGLTLLLTLLTFVKQTKAQGSAFSGTAFSSGTSAIGTVVQPIGGAVITVCSHTAGATQVPCSPTIRLYTDVTLSPTTGNNANGYATTNPFNADANGNFVFYAAVPTVDVSVTGVGVTGYRYTLTNGSSQKPQASDAVCYVSTNGNDSNDCLSMGTAKLTPQAGINALSSGGKLQLMAGTYSISSALTCSGVSSLTIEGPAFQGGGISGGAIISQTSTTATGLDVNNCPGMIVRNLTIAGPGSGSGIGLHFTSNSGQVQNVVVKNFGGDGCQLDGTRANSNTTRWDGVRCVSNGGIGLNVFGTNGNLNVLNQVEVSNNTGLGAQISSSANIFSPLHSFSNNGGTTGVSFLSGAQYNSGVIYSDSSTESTDVSFASGANANGVIFLPSGQTVSDSGINNSIKKIGMLQASGNASTPGYSFEGDSNTGFWDVGGGNGIAYAANGVSRCYLLTVSIRCGSGQVYAFSSAADPGNGGNDTGIDRASAGVVEIDNGFQGNSNGSLKLAGMSEALSTKSSSYTLTSSDSWINVTGTTTITVPHALTGQRWHVQNTGTATITLAPDSGTITCNASAAASCSMTPGSGAEITVDGTNVQATIVSVDNRIYAERMPGADPCAQISNAYTALPSTGGIIDGTAYQGTQTTCASGVSFTTSNKPVRLLLDKATFPLGTNQIVIQTNGIIIDGAPSWTGVPGTQFNYSGTSAAIEIGDGTNQFLDDQVNGVFVNATGSATSSATAVGIRCRNCVHMSFNWPHIENFAANIGFDVEGTSTSYSATIDIIHPLFVNNLNGLYTHGFDGSHASNQVRMIGGSSIGSGIAASSCIFWDSNSNIMQALGVDLEGCAHGINNGGGLNVDVQSHSENIISGGDHIHNAGTNLQIYGHTYAGTGTHFFEGGSGTTRCDIDLCQVPFVVPSASGTFAISNVGSLSAGWGNTATISAASGSTQRFNFTVSSSGTGQAANPTLTVTFPTTWPNTPFYQCKMVGGTNVFGNVENESSANTTTMSLQFIGTPSASNTVIIGCNAL